MHGRLIANRKQEMLQRGISAEDIRMVIAATSQRDGKVCATHTGMQPSMRQAMS
ncbi:MAG TPA: hypothetical protein VKU02_16695 [Gemmataceae bacterium]|nr:hypothetical protein [Gemmataceae bacterium]